jgi:tetratricopeptide (TPR) repeat protein
MEQVFDLQDRIVAQFSEALGTGRTESGSRRVQRETTSLEAYQAFTEGRVRLESLDGSQVAGAIADFERAIGLDPRYAIAHVGLGNARFWQYEMSRFRTQPDAALLARAIDHVRAAIELEHDLAEAHATLAFLLVSAGRATEALAAGRRAVAIEPGYWANQFRLAHAAWGSERLRALSRAMDMYPDFPFAHFEVAMVHIARGALDRAVSVLREATIVQDRQADLRQRYPARGLHWLLGMVRLAQGDAAEARSEFDKEIAGGATTVYAREFTANALTGAGLIHLRAGEGPAAVDMFRRALDLFPDHARTLVGLGAGLVAAGDRAGAEAAFGQATSAIEALRLGGRASEACTAEGLLHAVHGRGERAIEMLQHSLDRSELQFTGWTVPIEPLLEPFRALPSFQALLTVLADRAR